MKDEKLLFTSIILLFIAMVMLSYAFVPLYNLFCKATGYGGTIQEANIDYHSSKGSRTIKVQFNANVSKDLPWTFKPEQDSINVKPGENVLVFYVAENNSREDIIGTATYNVTPDRAGKYFNKIECFCFQNQLLEAGQKISLPVSFYIDPAFEEDDSLDRVNNIVLSYHFFRVKK